MEQQMNAMKQMVEMQKLVFSSMMNSTNMVLDQADSALNSVLGLAAWMPEEMKNAFSRQTENQRQALGYFKESVENGFDNLTKLLNEGKFPKFGL